VDSRLLVNAAVKKELRTEVRTDNNKTIDGYMLEDCDPMTTTQFAGELNWHGRSLNALAGKEVRLRFRLDDAALFTFDISTASAH